MFGYEVTEQGKCDWDTDEAFFIYGSSGGTGGGGISITNHNDLTGRDADNTHPVTSIELMTGVVPTTSGDGIVWDGAAWQSEPVKDHGDLTGLNDDDHLQYHTDARGDVRYANLGAFDNNVADTANPHSSSYTNIDVREPHDGRTAVRVCHVVEA